jgi:hypothetical protein
LRGSRFQTQWHLAETCNSGYLGNLKQKLSEFFCGLCVSKFKARHIFLCRFASVVFLSLSLALCCVTLLSSWLFIFVADVVPSESPFCECGILVPLQLSFLCRLCVRFIRSGFRVSLIFTASQSCRVTRSLLRALYQNSEAVSYETSRASVGRGFIVTCLTFRGTWRMVTNTVT